MNKAFVRETDDEEEDGDGGPEAAPLPAGTRNYMTVRGHRALLDELARLVKTERPELVKVVAWAASNGDRSENGDYIYGKKRLREMDRRIRYLTKRTESAVAVDPRDQANVDQVFFGATVTIDDGDAEATYQIVGVDEANPGQGLISWLSPLARALLKTREGDLVRFQSPAGWRELEVVEIIYR
jgi:transcription elongation factor GreB